MSPVPPIMTIFMTFLDFRATNGLACESEGRLRPNWPKSLAAMLDYDWIYLGNLSKRRAKSANFHLKIIV